MSQEWDAQTYDRIADPAARWGGAVVDRLVLNGDERVLDAGCGSGRVTAQLLERLPRGRVVALDGSAAMLQEARRRLGPWLDRVQFVHADLGEPIELGASVDAVLSTATFHWLPDHQRLFNNLAAVLRPGGVLVAQCGGRGNVTSVVEVMRSIRPDLPVPWHFASPEQTRTRLEAAGFGAVQAWLNEEPTWIEPGAALEEYLRTIFLPTVLPALAVADGDELVAGMARRLAGRELDYVRLNIVAVRN